MSLETIIRPQNVNLSESSLSRTASQILGWFCLGVLLLVVLGYVFFYAGGGDLESYPPKPLLYLFALLFGVGAYGALTYAYLFTTRPQQPLVYMPTRVAFKGLSRIIRIGLIFSAVALVLYSADSELSSDKMRRAMTIIQFMGAVFGLLFLYKIFEASRAAIQATRFGKSQFKFTVSQRLQRGMSFTGIFDSTRLSNMEERVEVRFWNLKEEWTGRQLPITTILSEQVQEVLLKGS